MSVKTFIRDYLYCVTCANHATALGYIFLLLACAMWWTSYKTHFVLLTLEVSIMLLSTTAFGLQTVYHYRRVRTLLAKRGTSSKSLAHSVELSGMSYCTRVAYRLAIREHLSTHPKRTS